MRNAPHVCSRTSILPNANKHIFIGPSRSRIGDVGMEFVARLMQNERPDEVWWEGSSRASQWGSGFKVDRLWIKVYSRFFSSYSDSNGCPPEAKAVNPACSRVPVTQASHPDHSTLQYKGDEVQRTVGPCKGNPHALDAEMQWRRMTPVLDWN